MCLCENRYSLRRGGTHSADVQLFQGVKKAVTPEPTAPAASDGGGFSLPSVPSLPSVGLPSIPLPDLSGLNVPTEAGIDPRTIALPGES